MPLPHVYAGNDPTARTPLDRRLVVVARRLLARVPIALPGLECSVAPNLAPVPIRHGTLSVPPMDLSLFLTGYIVFHISVKGLPDVRHQRYFVNSMPNRARRQLDSVGFRGRGWPTGLPDLAAPVHPAATDDAAPRCLAGDTCAAPGRYAPAGVSSWKLEARAGGRR